MGLLLALLAEKRPALLLAHVGAAPTVGTDAGACAAKRWLNSTLAPASLASDNASVDGIDPHNSAPVMLVGVEGECMPVALPVGDVPTLEADIATLVHSTSCV